MQRFEVSGAVRPLWWSLGVKGLRHTIKHLPLPNPLHPYILTNAMSYFRDCLLKIQEE